MDLTNFAIDKFGDFSVLGLIAVIGWVYAAMKNINSELRSLELKVAENYVTKPELQRVEEKIDNLSAHMSVKLDTVNNNLLVILQNTTKNT